MTTREKLLGLDLAQEKVKIDGLTIIVKEMTAGEGSEYENSLYKFVNGKVTNQKKTGSIIVSIASTILFMETILNRKSGRATTNAPRARSGE